MMFIECMYICVCYIYSEVSVISTTIRYTHYYLHYIHYIHKVATLYLYIHYTNIY